MNAPLEMPRAGRREWIGLAVLALPCLLYAMDMTVLNLAVPHLSADLKPSSGELLWIVDIYGFLIAGSLITMGTLGDRIGRRKLLLIGATAFGLASIFAAFATTPAMLIVARALLGLAAATLAPSTLSLLRNMFHDPRERTFAIGVWIASFSAGAAIGPLVGGALLAYFWWGSVFLIAVPVMVLLLVVGPFLLPEFRDPDAGRLDILSALMSLVAILSVIFGVKQIAEHGVSALALGAILLGIVLAGLFLLRQRKLADPLIDLALFREPAFSASLLVNLLAFFIAFGSFLFIAQYLQLVLGLSPLEAGLWSLPSSVAFIAGSMITPMLAGRIRPSLLMVSGLVIAAAGFAAVAWAANLGELIAMIAAFTLFSLGLAPVFTLTTDFVVGTVTPERAGAASAIAETCTELGGALGIALLGSIVTAVYRTGIVRTAPDGIPDEVAAIAHDTLGGALTVAADLPAPLGSRLVEGAQAAFSSGLVLAAALCAAIALAAALLVAVLLRNVNTSEPESGALAPAE
ncbi:MFS transporter [Nitratireductor pacificus]|uniref:Proton antiporter efflux pump n=1 Tax=Nitratireductor pacificus pht-3B TaxID=391937 RepID=K2N186_9HYPH|nr:MFS transporter [Nitratireductor pacificus]EKF17993.1 proton antiporter efflux pump [Nitratireductor pacificus pht-3B]